MGGTAPRHEGEHQGGMAERGVTRMEHGGGHDGMATEDRQRMLEMYHERVLWIYFAVVLLGAWLMVSPFVFGYTNPALVSDRVAQITAARDLPSIPFRAPAMTWSDVVSGALLVILGLLSLDARRIWAPWAAGVVGIWLLFAPLVFWAPTAAAYAIDSLVGILVIALTILIPGMPGMILIMKMGPEVPPGWTYNPSAWVQRAPVIALGWVGFFIARYMSAYQLGYIGYVWDPFFGDGTMRVLDSDVSMAWPVSDAALGAVA